MKNKKTIILSILLGASLLAYIGKNEEANNLRNEIEEMKQVSVISNENVEIEYIEVDEDIFDISITPKKNFNVIPEFELKDDTYYKQAWLVGLSKNKVKEINPKFEEKDWNQD